MLFTELKTQNNGTTSGCVVRHTASMPSSCNEQSELIPDPLRWHINKCLCNKRKGGMDLGSVIIDCEFKHYNRVSGKEISEC